METALHNRSVWGLWGLRLAWALMLGIMVITTIVRAPYNDQATFQQWEVANTASRLPGVNWVSFAQYIIGLRYAGAAVFVLLGIVVFVIRPRSGMAILVSITLISMPLIFSGFGINPGDYRLSRQGVPNAVIPLLYLGEFIAFGSSMLTLYLFPDGKFAPRWLRWTLIGWGLLAVLGSFWKLPDLFGYIFVVLALALLIVMFAGQIYRYTHTSDAVQKQQTRLAVAGILLQPLLLVITSPVRAIDNPWYTLFMLHAAVAIPLAVPITLALSILRYRLWDIEVVIRRTLVYSTVTVILGGAYIGMIVVLQAGFVAITGQESALAVVISTLVSAALFTPLRRRVQQGIDRRFFRQKYDAQQTIDTFSEAIRDDVDVDVVGGHLLAAVEATLQPEHLSLWLLPSDRKEQE